MQKSFLIFLIGLPASGKSTIGKLLASKYGFSYLDKDVVCNRSTGLLLEQQGYAAHDRDGCPFYRETVMDIEYSTLLDIANDNLKLGNSVILDAPFVSYFPNKEYINQIKEKYNLENTTPLVLQINVDLATLKSRLTERGLDRDMWKLKNWGEYTDLTKANVCKWENIDIHYFDNTSPTIDTEKLFTMLQFK